MWLVGSKPIRSRALSIKEKNPEISVGKKKNFQLEKSCSIWSKTLARCGADHGPGTGTDYEKCVNRAQNSVRKFHPGKRAHLFRLSTFSGNFPVGWTDKTCSIYCRTGKCPKCYNSNNISYACFFPQNNDVMCRALWCHLSSLPQPFSINYLKTWRVDRSPVVLLSCLLVMSSCLLVVSSYQSIAPQKTCYAHTDIRELLEGESGLVLAQQLVVLSESVYLLTLSSSQSRQQYALSETEACRSLNTSPTTSLILLRNTLHIGGRVGIIYTAEVNIKS